MKGNFNLIQLMCGIRVQQWDMLTVSYRQKTMKVLPMLPSTETRFSLFSRLSFRGLGHALLAVGDMLSSSNVAEMYNNTRYSYSQFPDKQAGRSILALKLQVPPTGNSCVQTAGALHITPNRLFMVVNFTLFNKKKHIHNTWLQKKLTWKLIIGIIVTYKNY